MNGPVEEITFGGRGQGSAGRSQIPTHATSEHTAGNGEPVSVLGAHTVLAAHTDHRAYAFVTWIQIDVQPFR